jgi:hypothetical protein
MQANGWFEIVSTSCWTAAPTQAPDCPHGVVQLGVITRSALANNGEPLAAKGVVLVTYNYRLGLFGFSRIRTDEGTGRMPQAIRR